MENEKANILLMGLGVSEKTSCDPDPTEDCTPDEDPECEPDQGD